MPIRGNHHERRANACEPNPHMNVNDRQNTSAQPSRTMRQQNKFLPPRIEPEGRSQSSFAHVHFLSKNTIIFRNGVVARHCRRHDLLSTCKSFSSLFGSCATVTAGHQQSMPNPHLRHSLLLTSRDRHESLEAKHVGVAPRSGIPRSTIHAALGKRIGAASVTTAAVGRIRLEIRPGQQTP